jgi:hypothetical protein
MARLGLLERIKLTPEGITVEEAKRLIRHMAALGHKVFVLTFHTLSRVPRNTPYVRNQSDLDRFMAWLEEIYDFFKIDLGARRSFRKLARCTGCHAGAGASPAIAGR